MIKDLVEGTVLDSVSFLIKDAIKIDRDTGSYMNLVLQDSTGTIDAKKWKATDEDAKLLEPGKVIILSGRVNTYMDKMQLIIDRYFVTNEQNPEEFCMISPIPFDELNEKFRNFVRSVKVNDLKMILNEVFRRYSMQFLAYPAAVKNHHEFYHGLLHHSVSMCEIADSIASHYKDVNRDLLISGCLLHDIGKLFELSGVVATKYTTEGNLLGHLTIGMSLIREIAKELDIKSDYPILLEHMILSHHGKLEYGACVLPETREALLLSMIDDMDAKMMILDKAYNGVKKGEYTERIFALDNRSFYKGNF